MIEVSGLNIYPVKSMQGISVEDATLSVRGLEFDRNWILTDSNLGFLTQREIPAMASIGVSLASDSLVLEHPSISPLTIGLDGKNSSQEKVAIWDDLCSALDEGLEASVWFTEVLGRWKGNDLKLFRFAEDYVRRVDHTYLRGENSHTAFADGFPFLISSGESLALLNERLKSRGASAVSMNRFRPNIVIRGIEPFEEDRFESLNSNKGIYAFGIRKPCQRCVMTSLDQFTGQQTEPKEPLRTLTQLNTQPDLKGAFFGQNATLLSGKGQQIKVGNRLLSHKVDA